MTSTDTSQLRAATEEDERPGESQVAEEGESKQGDDHMEGVEEGREENPKGKQKEKETVKMSEKYNENDADVIIVSSDGVAFKVHSLILGRASPSFKSMFDIAHSPTQRDPIVLSDDTLESSVVLKAAFDILYDREVESFRNERLYRLVIEFARKWDIPAILKTISKEIRCHVSDSRSLSSPTRLFRLAVDLGDINLMTTIVEAKHNDTFGAGKPTPEPEQDRLPRRKLNMPKPSNSGVHQEYIAGGRKFDPGAWPYTIFAQMPRPIVWALLRAQVTPKRASEPTEVSALLLAHRERSQQTVKLSEGFKKAMDFMYPDNQLGSVSTSKVASTPASK